MTSGLGDSARRAGDDLLLSVRVHPRASRNAITGVDRGALQVRTTAAPADGKANRAVIKMIARYLGVAPSTIKLLRGQTHRNKQFLVKNAANRL